jgi:hypothetical protein
MVRSALIRETVKALRDRLHLNFILVGGAAALWLGNTRDAGEVNILINPDISLIPTASPTTDRIIIEESNMWYKPGGIFNIKIDVLSDIFEENYQTLLHHTMTVNDVRVLTPEYALAIKVFRFHHRGDGYYDDLKRYSDIDDIVFYCDIMRTEGGTISQTCADRFRIGAYRMAYLRMWMTDDQFQNLLEIEIGRFLIPWSEDTDVQKECYSLLTAGTGTDPLTDPLPQG